MSKEIIYNGLTIQESKKFMKEINEKSFRGEQLFSFINKNRIKNIDDITVFSKKLKEKLKLYGRIRETKILKRYDSKIDDTKKYLFLLDDNNIIEGVYMKYKHGNSLCISTQVGCRMGCKFCASTKDGLVRNLEVDELLSQIYLVEKDLNLKISNIVLMGSGEPLDNYNNVIKFIHIVNDKKGNNLSMRNISLSTCGLAKEIEILANEKLPITLSISLHNPINKNRDKIMPINKKYNIDRLIESLKYYQERNKRRITIEYTLIKGVNDREKDIKKLKELLRGMNVHINVIPLNPIKEYRGKRPSNDYLENFTSTLRKEGLNATVRKEKGLDINASCGQLRKNYLQKNNK